MGGGRGLRKGILLTGFLILDTKIGAYNMGSKEKNRDYGEWKD